MAQRPMILSSIRLRECNEAISEPGFIRDPEIAAVVKLPRYDKQGLFQNSLRRR